MVPWLRPRRMRDVSVVMIAEAMMRAISALSAKPAHSFNLHLPGHLHMPHMPHMLHMPHMPHGRHAVPVPHPHGQQSAAAPHAGRISISADHKPAPRCSSTSETSEIHRDHSESASASAEGHVSEIELCTTDDPSRVRLVFPAPFSGQQTVELYCSASNPGAADLGRLMQSGSENLTLLTSPPAWLQHELELPSPTGAETGSSLPASTSGRQLVRLTTSQLTLSLSLTLILTLTLTPILTLTRGAASHFR